MKITPSAVCKKVFYDFYECFDYYWQQVIPAQIYCIENQNIIITSVVSFLW